MVLLGSFPDSQGLALYWSVWHLSMTRLTAQLMRAEGTPVSESSSNASVDEAVLVDRRRRLLKSYLAVARRQG